jgi:hypothetical protein
MRTYITRNCEIIGEVKTKSQAFKLAWDFAKAAFKKYGKKGTLTIRDYFNFIVGDVIRRFYATISGIYAQQVAKELAKELAINPNRAEQDKQYAYYQKLTNFTMD